MAGFSALLVLPLLSPGPACAGFLDPAWHYDIIATPSPIVLNAATGTKIILTDESPNATVARQGSSDIAATNIYTTSNSNSSVVYANLAYNLKLTIKDDESGASVVLNYGGLLSGSVSKHGSLTTNVFDDNTSHTYMLGLNSYTVKVDSFVAPSGPGANNAGSIGGNILVNGHPIIDPPPPTNDTPEPATLLLGLSGIALVCWRKLWLTKSAIPA